MMCFEKARRLLAALILGTGVPFGAATAQGAATQRPTLVVMLTVDQLRPDYLTMYERQFTGGFARLLRGAVFLNGFQDHANTETAPGHASILSGRFPRSTGIVSNSAGVFDPQAPLVGARGDPASPFRFRGSSFADWIRFANPQAKALSVSRKDRGAILPLGRAKQSVFWYAFSNGSFTTSTYYADTLPTWVRAFNERRLPHQWAGRVWDLLLDPAEYQEVDSVAVENQGQRFVFPHVLPSDPAQAAAAITAFPMMDQLTLSFALEGVRNMKLGAGPGTDLLAVSVSATDAIGHRFGPDSREVHDQILRLDRYLGAFLDTLYTLRDSANVVIALTADHAVSPLPEARSRYPNQGAGRVNVTPAIVPLFASLRAAGVDTSGFAYDNEGMLYLDEAALTKAGLRMDAVIRTFRTEVEKVRGVLRVDKVSSLEADTAKDDIARRWYHQLPPDLPVAAVVTLKPFWYWHDVGFATHGSPHDIDAQVPIIFYGAGIKPGRHSRRALVVDIAPTLAAVAQVRSLEPLDGRVLREALRP